MQQTCIQLQTTGCSRKNTAQSLHVSVLQLYIRVMRFSVNCSERNCLHDKGQGQCLNIEMKCSLFCSWQVNYFKTKLIAKSVQSILSHSAPYPLSGRKLCNHFVNSPALSIRRALINKWSLTLDVFIVKCKCCHCWHAATSRQLTKNIYHPQIYFYRLINSSLCCTFWCKHHNPKTNGSILITWQTLCNFFLEHSVRVLLISQLLAPYLSTLVLTIGVGGSSVNFRGAQHFCPRNMYEKFTKCPNFTWFLSKKLSKYPNFYDIHPKNKQNSGILHDSCPTNTWILHNNCPPPNIFPELFLGGTCPSCPPSPTHMLLTTTTFGFVRQPTQFKKGRLQWETCENYFRPDAVSVVQLTTRS